MKTFTKQYQLWVKADYGYNFTEFDTITECLTAEKYTSDWYITKNVGFKVEEI